MQARTKIRVVCARPYHALFMHNMLIRPTEQELREFGEPEFVIYNAGGCSLHASAQPLQDLGKAMQLGTWHSS